MIHIYTNVDTHTNTRTYTDSLPLERGRITKDITATYTYTKNTFF